MTRLCGLSAPSAGWFSLLMLVDELRLGAERARGIGVVLQPCRTQLTGSLLEGGDQRPRLLKLRHEGVEPAPLGGDVGERTRGIGVQLHEPLLARLDLGP